MDYHDEPDDGREFLNEATVGCKQTGDMVNGVVWQREEGERYVYIVTCDSLGGPHDGHSVEVEGDTLGLALDALVATGDAAMFNAGFCAVLTTVEDWAAVTGGPA